MKTTNQKTNEPDSINERKFIIQLNSKAIQRREEKRLKGGIANQKNVIR